MSGRRIRRARIDHGWTQEELAGRMHFTVRAISRWETGKQEPKVTTWPLLSEMLGEPIAYLRASDLETGGRNGDHGHTQ